MAWQHDRGASPRPRPSSRCHLPKINAAPCRQPRRRRLPSYPRSAAACSYGERSSDGAEVLHAFRDGGHDFVEVVAASYTQGVSPRSRPWSPHRRGWSTPSAYSLWRSLLLFRSRGDRILPMCPSPTTSSSPGWPAWISPLLPSTSLPRARRSATMDPPAGGSREPAVLPCCSGEKVTWLSVHEEWSSVKYLYTWPLLLIHVHGEEQTTAHSCFVPLLCATFHSFALHY